MGGPVGAAPPPPPPPPGPAAVGPLQVVGPLQQKKQHTKKASKKRRWRARLLGNPGIDVGRFATADEAFHELIQTWLAATAHLPNHARVLITTFDPPLA